MRIVVITAITGNRDLLKEQQNTAGADFVAFSDLPLQSDTWQVRPACDLFRDPVRNAKLHKILPHLFFPEYEFSLWMDATLELADPAPGLVERYLRDHDVVFGGHASHRSLDDELEACYRETLDDPAIVRQQVAAYAVRRPPVGVFPLASAVLRRHTPAVARFNEAWWAEICRWSRRDQLSLLHAADTAGVSWATFPRQNELENDTRHRHLGSPHFRWFSHGAGPQAAAPSPAEPLPVWSRARLEFLERVCGQREAYALDLEAELAKRTESAKQAERYAQSLEQELAKRTEWAKQAERYAQSLEEELARVASRVES